MPGREPMLQYNKPEHMYQHFWMLLGKLLQERLLGTDKPSNLPDNNRL